MTQATFTCQSSSSAEQKHPRPSQGNREDNGPQIEEEKQRIAIDTARHNFVWLAHSGETWQGYFRMQEVLDFHRPVSVSCWTQKITSASSRWKQFTRLAN